MSFKVLFFKYFKNLQNYKLIISKINSKFRIVLYFLFQDLKSKFIKNRYILKNIYKF